MGRGGGVVVVVKAAAGATPCLSLAHVDIV